jgi:dihydroneopterin aldolase
MEVPTKLLETVVVRMLDAVLGKYPLVEKIEIKLSKMNPPLGGKLRSVSVKMDKQRI